MATVPGESADATYAIENIDQACCRTVRPPQPPATASLTAADEVDA